VARGVERSAARIAAADALVAGVAGADPLRGAVPLVPRLARGTAGSPLPLADASGQSRARVQRRAPLAEDAQPRVRGRAPRAEAASVAWPVLRRREPRAHGSYTRSPPPAGPGPLAAGDGQGERPTLCAPGTLSSPFPGCPWFPGPRRLRQPVAEAKRGDRRAMPGSAGLAAGLRGTWRRRSRPGVRPGRGAARPHAPGSCAPCRPSGNAGVLAAGRVGAITLWRVGVPSGGA